MKQFLISKDNTLELINCPGKETLTHSHILGSDMLNFGGKIPLLNKIRKTKLVRRKF